MDWLASVRVHPANDVIQNAAQAVPLLLLGFSPATLGAYIAVLSVFAVMLHSNVGWAFGPLRYVVSSPGQELRGAVPVARSRVRDVLYAEGRAADGVRRVG
jgi:hypothetical protein